MGCQLVPHVGRKATSQQPRKVSGAKDEAECLWYKVKRLFRIRVEAL